MNLSTLAPNIVAAILDDALPNHITLLDLAVDPPALWQEQREKIRHPAAALRGRCGCGVSHVAGECGILHELIAAAHGEACACHLEAPFDPPEAIVPEKAPARRNST